MIITVVIPCYNVAVHIDEVIKNIPSDITWIIAIDDCSTDETENRILQLQQENKRIVYIKHETNQGVGGAMVTGFKRSLELNSNITIKLDGDDQMDASYIPALIKPIIENKADFTKGNRFRDLNALRSMPVIRRIGNLGLSFLIKAASGYWNIYDPANGFIAINDETLKNLNFDKLHKRYYFETSLLIELYHSNTVVMDVPMKARYGNEVSGLSVTRVLFEFPPKLFIAFIKRIILKYFLFEFNIASLYILFGLPLFLLGTVYGLVNYVNYSSSQEAAPTGTVVIPTLLIILGFQLLLSAVNYDIGNYPKKQP
jgi:dolichol-phosphate mannosyltransferase